MPSNWIPRNVEQVNEIDAEVERVMALKEWQRKSVLADQPVTPVQPPEWQPANQWQRITPEVPVTEQASRPFRQSPSPIPPAAGQAAPPLAPPFETTVQAEVTQTPSRELDPLHPFKIPSDEPLWSKALNVAFKPFELVQEYAFDPILGALHGKITDKKLTPEQLTQAKKEGIGSFFPGGIRHQAYEELKYPGKWAVEMIPWLAVPGIGQVAKGTGIAGALGKLGKAGQVAGKVAELSPAGLMEKGTNTVVSKMTGLIKQAEKVLPQQKQLTHEFRVKQLANAMPELEKGYGEQGFRNFMRKLGGEQETVQFTPIGSQFSQAEKDSLYEIIRKSTDVRTFDKAAAGKGLKKIFDGQLPVESELEQLQKLFGDDLVNALLEKRPRSAMQVAMDVANAPRAVLSSVDLSGLLRQGAILTARRPGEAAKTFTPMVKSFFSEKVSNSVDELIRARPNTQLGLDHSLYLAPLPSNKLAALSKLEESYMSRFIEKVPGLGQLVKASNRAYVTGLNDLRSRVWESTLQTWNKLSPTDVDYSELARLINAASGRGTLPKALQGASPLLNATLFSPRLLVSRLELPTMLASSSPLVRKEAARTLAQFLGAGTAILSMAALAGAKVELNPKSADFGKIRIGNTRLDIWSGYSQWARFVAQATSGERKTAGGNIMDVNRREVVDRFLQSKYSPAFSLLNDILKGESYAGEEMSLDTLDLRRQAFTRLAPLFVQDMLDAIEQEGLVGGMVAVPGLFGIGVTTYISPSQKMREQLAQQKYGKTWEDVGKDPALGRAAQLQLEMSSPKLKALINLEAEEYNQTVTGKSDVNNIYRNDTATIERQYKAAIQLATQEFKDTGDGYRYREKINQIASNRRSQYEVLNKNPMYKDIVARYDTLPNPQDLTRMSPQDVARKEYMRLLYSADMYDQYGNYLFDRIDEMRAYFASVFGEEMLEYIETYQGIKDTELPPEYKEFKQAQKVLRPYWQVQDEVETMYGKPETASQVKRQDALISKIRKRMRQSNPEMERYYQLFYVRPEA